MKVRFIREPLAGNFLGERFPAKGETRTVPGNIATDLIAKGFCEAVAEPAEQRAESAVDTAPATAERRGAGRPRKAKG